LKGQDHLDHVDSSWLSSPYGFCVLEFGLPPWLFATFVHDEAQLNLETTGGYISFLNGKVERQNRTLADRVPCMLINTAAPHQDWCFAV
jgi:hypothetical protein